MREAAELRVCLQLGWILSHKNRCGFLFRSPWKNKETLRSESTSSRVCKKTLMFKDALTLEQILGRYQSILATSKHIDNIEASATSLLYWAVRLSKVEKLLSFPEFEKRISNFLIKWKLPFWATSKHIVNFV